MREQNKRVFVSSRFTNSIHSEGEFLSELLVQLNLQQLTAIIYRGLSNPIRIGENIYQRNSKDIELCDAFIPILSKSYLRSDFCKNETLTALHCKHKSNLLIIPVIWPDLQCSFSDIPAPFASLINDDQNKEKYMCFVSSGMNNNFEGETRKVTKDVCSQLTIPFYEETDPPERIKLAKRIIKSSFLFREPSNDLFDGHLDHLIRDIAMYHRISANKVDGETLEHLNSFLEELHEQAQKKFSKKSLAFFYIAKAMNLLKMMQNQPKNKWSDLETKIADQINKAINHGDPETVRDAFILKGNVDFLVGEFPEAESSYLQAQCISSSLENNKISLNADLKELLINYSANDMHYQINKSGSSAIVFFDNLLKCQLAQGSLPKNDEIIEHYKKISNGLIYTHVGDFERYVGLTSIALLLTGNNQKGQELINNLNSQIDIKNSILLKTWIVVVRILTRLNFDKKSEKFNSSLFAEKLFFWGKDIGITDKNNQAILFYEISYFLENHEIYSFALKICLDAVKLYPDCIPFSIDAARIAIQDDKIDTAYELCTSVTKKNLSVDLSYGPLKNEGFEHLCYLQGLAFWLLGKKTEAKDRYKLSNTSENNNNSMYNSNWYGEAIKQHD